MRAFVTGDTHGEIEEFCQRIDWMLGRKDNDGFIADTNTVLIILGDFGGNFGGEYLKHDIEFKQSLQDIGITYFVIRGNHDQRPSNLYNGDTWHMENLFDGPTFVENQFPNIHYAMDYPWVYNIEGKKTLVLPGAYSIDKDWRINHEKIFGVRSWFADEQMTPAEREYVWTLCRLNDYKFDVILSHTCPWARIPRYSPNIPISGKVDNTMEYLFDDIDQKVDYKSWLWGHHHEDEGYEYNNHHNACLYTTIKNFNRMIEDGFYYKRMEIADTFLNTGSDLNG